MDPFPKKGKIKRLKILPPVLSPSLAPHYIIIIHVPLSFSSPLAVVAFLLVFLSLFHSPFRSPPFVLSLRTTQREEASSSSSSSTSSSWSWCALAPGEARAHHGFLYNILGEIFQSPSNDERGIAQSGERRVRMKSEGVPSFVS